MGFIGKMFKGAVAAKAVSVARKPENQARAKSALGALRSKVTGKGSGTSGAAAKPARNNREQPPTAGRPAKPRNRTR